LKSGANRREQSRHFSFYIYVYDADMAAMRIQKYLSEQGILSRRKAEEYIRAGKIRVNGQVAQIGHSIDPTKDKVEVMGETTTQFTSVLVYKPRGISSARAGAEGKTIYDLLPQFSKLHIAGRLDKESEGLLILTNDGILAKQLTSDKHLIEKEYEVHTQERVEGPMLGHMTRGIKLKDGMTLPAEVTKISHNKFKIILREGRNHQIRRMADAVHLTVARLTRKRIGPLTTSKLQPGAFRELTPQEVSTLKSSKS
jgi:23S rRNA pseudouridine2605 synthase